MLLNSDLKTFRRLFETRLGDMLSSDELGAFLLVFANSMQDGHLRSTLAPRLALAFSELKEHHKNHALKATDDDLLVFQALLNSGIGHFGGWKKRTIGPWRAAHNPLRALRPRRASAEPFESLNRAFDEHCFHFDKPFLKPEILSDEIFNGYPVRVFYQKFPFATYHLLIVLEPQGHHAQVLTASWLQLIWELALHVAESIAGFALGYNSLGACASVNHLHVHGFIDTDTLPIEAKNWQHNGGHACYPLQCYAVFSVHECWKLVRQLHENNQPYNLLFRCSVCYVIPRAAQGQRKLPAWLPDAGWYELSGGFNLPGKIDFDNLTEHAIEAGLSKLRL